MNPETTEQTRDPMKDVPKPENMDDPKSWTPAQRQVASYIPTRDEYAKGGYAVENYEAFVSKQSELIKSRGLTPHSNRQLRPEGAHYLIEATMGVVRKNMNIHQRSSSRFSVEPRIGTKTLRRGVKLRFTEAQMKMHDLTIRRLHKAHAIEIYKIDADGKKTDVRIMAPGVPVKVTEPEAISEEDKALASLEEQKIPPTELTDPKVDLQATQEVKITPPAEAMSGGPDPTAVTTLPVNPAATATDTELDAATELEEAEDDGKVDSSASTDPGTHSKKKGKKAKKE